MDVGNRTNNKPGHDAAYKMIEDAYSILGAKADGLTIAQASQLARVAMYAARNLTRILNHTHS